MTPTGEVLVGKDIYQVDHPFNCTSGILFIPTESVIVLVVANKEETRIKRSRFYRVRLLFEE